MRTDDLDYNLPPELIAQTPAIERDQARLLVSRGRNIVEHHHVRDLPDLLERDDLLVINDTRVIPARFYAVRQTTGGKIEGLYLDSISSANWHVMLKSGGRLHPGETLQLGDSGTLELLKRLPDGSWNTALHSDLDTLSLLNSIGIMPLPPYIRRTDALQQELSAMDRQRYQTVYAGRSGAVAAPTAGLHFTQELLERLAGRGIEIARLTLHVGAGTFAPVRCERLEDHPMHGEHFTVPAETLEALLEARRRHRRIIAVGTTSVRALESLPAEFDASNDYSAQTTLLIQPGFVFRYTDGLMTNFHLPRSTLLALVAALTGLERLKALYALAIEQRYRFYSYGDAMLILP